MSREYVFHTQRDDVSTVVAKAGGCPLNVSDDDTIMGASDENAVEEAISVLSSDAEEDEDVRLKFKHDDEVDDG